MLRGSGVKWDLRKVDHYECYDDFDWEVQWETAGDALARYMVRMREMRESTKIIRQALKGLPGGPYENLEAKRMAAGPKSEWNGPDYQFISKKLAPTWKVPAGEHYVRLESGKGELVSLSKATTPFSPGGLRFALPTSITYKFCPTF